MLELKSGVISVVLGGLVPNLIIKSGVSKLELLRYILNTIVLKSGAVHNTI